MENRIYSLVKSATRLCCLILWCVSTAFTNAVFAQQQPVCPNQASATPFPTFADVGEPPNVGIWKKLSRLPSACHISTDAPALLSVSIAATFSFSGNVEDLAGRFGAVSKTEAVKYWSTTDDNWRELVTNANALQSENKKSTRGDFSAKEILSGETLYFAQNDTRSWGVNVFSMKKITATADQLAVISQNVRPVRIGPVKLFGTGDLQTIVFFSRVDSSNWRYYSLSVVKDSALPAPEKSLVNRQAALYRYLTGQQTDSEPPLSP